MFHVKRANLNIEAMPQSEDDAMPDDDFDEWCILELMGHRRLAGRVRSVTIDIDQINAGDILTIDTPFPCLRVGDEHEIFKDCQGVPFIDCDVGMHYIGGALDDPNITIGPCLRD